MSRLLHIVDWRNPHRTLPRRIAWVRLFVVIDFLTFSQHVKAATFHRAAMEEQVVPARCTFGLDEAKTLVVS